MKYHEIVAPSDRKPLAGKAKTRNQTSIKTIDPNPPKDPIHRLFDDLMDTLEKRLMNVAPVAKPGRR